MGDCRRYLEETTGVAFPPSSPPAGWPPPPRKLVSVRSSTDGGKTWRTL
jgi:hypothetical protein